MTPAGGRTFAPFLRPPLFLYCANPGICVFSANPSRQFCRASVCTAVGTVTSRRTLQSPRSVCLTVTSSFVAAATTRTLNRAASARRWPPRRVGVVGVCAKARGEARGGGGRGKGGNPLSRRLGRRPRAASRVRPRGDASRRRDARVATDGANGRAEERERVGTHRARATRGRSATARAEGGGRRNRRHRSGGR
eukprot:31566-Pelagococcus_subviridis.AAC.12